MLQAPPDGNDEAEPLEQCVPRQSLGTRANTESIMREGRLNPTGLLVWRFRISFDVFESNWLRAANALVIGPVGGTEERNINLDLGEKE